MTDVLSQYEYLWNGTSPGWVLVRSHVGEKESPYVVFNERTSMLLLIENRRTHEAVCEQLLSLGAKVLDRMPRADFRIENLDGDGGAGLRIREESP
jgi:hypothetical protein